MIDIASKVMSIGTGAAPIHTESHETITAKRMDFWPFPVMKRKAEQGKVEILKAMHRGAPPMFLFLQAAELIGILTGDETFINQCGRDTGAIYGRGLGELVNLQIECKQARQRLEKLQAARAAEPTPEYCRALDMAIKEHKALIANLEEKMSDKSA